MAKINGDTLIFGGEYIINYNPENDEYNILSEYLKNH